MRCPACGHDNPDSNLFCAKCATSLARQQVRAGRASKVLLPPQSDMADRPARQTEGQFPIGWIVVVIIIATALAIYYYW